MSAYLMTNEPRRCWPWQHHWHRECRSAPIAPYGCQKRERTLICEMVCCKCGKAKMEYYRAWEQGDEYLTG